MMFVAPAVVIVFFLFFLSLFHISSIKLQICTSKFAWLELSPEDYVQSMVDYTCQNYTQQMSKPGTWCDNKIIQELSHAFNSIDSNAVS